MQKVFFTPEGKVIRTLSAVELQDRADNGDYEAKKEIAKDKIGKAMSLQDELDAIKEMLGL